MADVFSGRADYAYYSQRIYRRPATPSTSSTTNSSGSATPTTHSALPSSPLPQMSQKAAPVAAPTPIAEAIDPSQSDLQSPSPAFRQLASLIGDENKSPFTTPGRLARKIERQIHQCQQAEKGCYLLVHGVPPDKIPEIDDAFRALEIHRTVRCTYEELLQSLIIRLMPGAPHKNTGGSFIRRVEAKIELLPGHSWRSYNTAGGTRFSASGKRSKEGDQGIIPSNRERPDDWPTLVLEVGDSESLPLLRNDAKWWLENSWGKTKLVILIKITKAPSPNSLRIECWEMMPNQTQSATRSRTPMTPQMDQFFDTDAAGDVTTNPEKKDKDLTIPYDRIFDPPFPDSAPDIIISNNELSEWALHIFKRF